MSVVNITQDRKTWTGSSKASGREYSIDYLVQFDNPYQGCAAAVAALSLRIGSMYRVGSDGDPSAVLKSLDPRCDGGNLFRVTAKWGPRDPQQEDQNPFDRPTVWSYHPQAFRKVIWKDNAGKGILNSAGEYFDPPVEDDVFRPVVTARRNVPVFDDARADKFCGKLNKDTWKGRKPGTVRCVGISGEGPNFENGYEFFVETLEFHINPDGWDLKILDQGRNEFYVGPGARVPIKVKDAAGNSLPDYVSDPVPLTKDGNNAIELTDPTPDTVKFLTFKIHKRLNFAELAL